MAEIEAAEEVRLGELEAGEAAIEEERDAARPTPVAEAVDADVVVGRLGRRWGDPVNRARGVGVEVGDDVRVLSCGYGEGEGEGRSHGSSSSFLGGASVPTAREPVRGVRVRLFSHL
jgi:hypothetical protein